MSLYYLRKGPQGYYRPDSQGYTDDIREAGIFSEWTARGVVESTHGEVTMIPERPPEKGSYITVEVLDIVLSNAIAVGKKMGHADSAYLRGIISNHSYLRRHKTLDIRP